MTFFSPILLVNLTVCLTSIHIRLTDAAAGRFVAQALKNLSSPLYLRQIVTPIRELSHKIGLDLNRLGIGLQRFLLAFSPFCDELKYTPERDFFFHFSKNKK